MPELAKYLVHHRIVVHRVHRMVVHRAHRMVVHSSRRSVPLHEASSRSESIKEVHQVHRMVVHRRHRMVGLIPSQSLHHLHLGMAARDPDLDRVTERSMS